MRIIIALLFFLAPTCYALPDAPKPKVVDRQFITEMAILGVAKMADGITTQRNMNEGAIERNPIFGQHPSPARLAGVNAAYFAGEVAEAYCLKRWVRNKHLRWVWMIEPSFQTQEHIRFSINNARTHR